MSFNSFISTKSSTHQSILDQIDFAFSQKPNIAAILHGQRRIHQGSPGRRTSLFPSRKCGGAIALESRLELAYAVQLEGHPDVESYRTQALKISLSENHVAYPDFLIRNHNGNYEVHEVKPSIQELSTDILQRFDRIAAVLGHICIQFKIIDSSSLLQRQSLNQVLQLYSRGHSREWTNFEINLAKEVLADQVLENKSQIYLALERNQISPHLGDYLLFHKLIETTNAKNNNLSWENSL